MRQILGVMIVVLALFSMPVASVADETAKPVLTPEYLVEKSPWSGEWVNPPYNGTMELVFSLKEGKLQGKIQKFTGSTQVINGPVSYIEVSDGVLKFQSRTGADYELTFKNDGKLEGKSHRRNGTTAWMVFKPATAKITSLYSDRGSNALPPSFYYCTAYFSICSRIKNFS